MAAVVVACIPALATAAACSARSPAYTTALVELYTAEACTSCPQADRWLASTVQAYPRHRLAALVLPVDSWDYLGWKDPAARRDFTQRQKRLSPLQRRALVYTPHLLLQGGAFTSWGGSEFDVAVGRINARPAAAHLSLAVARASSGGLRVTVTAQAEADASVYVAAYDAGVAGGVPVALEWHGPFAVGAHEMDLPLLPKAQAAESGAAAFVQSRRSGEVLQVLMVAACAR